MLIAKGNIWTYLGKYPICITTNAVIKMNGEAVMGAGIALEAAKRYPSLPRWLAKRLADGNHVYLFYTPEGYELVTFPTKYDWKSSSTTRIIKRSAKELVALADENQWEKVLVPRPGCGKGNLTWEEVRPVIEPLFDNRFIVVNND